MILLKYLYYSFFVFHPHFQFFPGSTDRNTPETQLLGTPVSAQYIRLLPLDFSGQAGLRFDVLGCTPDCKEVKNLLIQINIANAKII